MAIPTAEVYKPILTGDMLQPDKMGGVLAQIAFKKIFGSENFNLFKRAGIGKDYIGEEDRQRVDREVYARIATIFGKPEDGGEQVWRDAIKLSNQTLNYARTKLFADPDNQVTLTTILAVGEKRPSRILERLTGPTDSDRSKYTKPNSLQLKYEQGIQLALALLCAEVISSDENGHSEKILEEVNNTLEEQFFIDKRKGDPKPYPTVFSYHEPKTNKLVGISKEYADPNFAEDLWVKALDFHVRTIGLRNFEDEWPSVEATYEPRPKDIESAVIKALHRSLKYHSNGGLIETAPYSEDQIALRLVLMAGGHTLRDVVTAQLEDLFRVTGSKVAIVKDHEVNPANGYVDRVRFRRMQVANADLERPFEVVVQTLPDYISSEYEIGEFDPSLGMHNGAAHDLYKLGIVAEVASYLWPPQIYDIKDRTSKLTRASYEYATRLARRERVYPSPYPELIA